MKKKAIEIYKHHAVKKVLLVHPTLSFLVPVRMSLRSPASIFHDYCNSELFPAQISTTNPCSVPLHHLSKFFSFSPLIFFHQKARFCFVTLFHNLAFLFSSPSKFLCKLDIPLCIFHLPSTPPCWSLQRVQGHKENHKPLHYVLECFLWSRAS